MVYLQQLDYKILPQTAASTNLNGKVVDQFGRGISRANVTLTKTNGETITLLTNSFGNFSFPNLEVGGFILNVRRKGYFFKENTITHQQPFAPTLTEFNFLENLYR